MTTEKNETVADRIEREANSFFNLFRRSPLLAVALSLCAGIYVWYNFLRPPSEVRPTSTPLAAETTTRPAKLLAYEQYLSFLEDMDSFIDAKTMTAGADAGGRFNRKFSMLKAALPTFEKQALADTLFEVIYCRVHRDHKSENNDIELMAKNCNEKKVSTDVVLAKRELATLFGQIPYQK